MDRFIIQSNQLHDTQTPQPPLEKTLSTPILLSDRISRALSDAPPHLFTTECHTLAKKLHALSHMLRAAVTLSTSTPFYDRPTRRIFTDVTTHLHRTFKLVKKCRRRSFFRRFFSIVTVSDFKKVFGLIDGSIGDMTWLLSLFDNGDGNGNNGVVLSLPPICANDPILAWVWSYISSLYLLTNLNVKIEVARELTSLARDSDRNKKVIVEEGGVAPLLKMMKEDSVEGKIASANAIFCLVNERVRARVVFVEHGVGVIVSAFRSGSILVQIEVVKVIGRLCEFDSVCQEAFARENVIGMLVTLLAIDMFDDGNDDSGNGKVSKSLRKSIGSAVEIDRKLGDLSSGNSIWSRNRKESKNEVSKLILEFKTSCSGALWMLARGNVENCRMITETKGLLCLAKLIEREKGELQINCLMTVLEVTTAAECNPDFRRAAFKTNSPAAKAITEQLIRLVNQSDNPVIKIPAIRAIGHLARTFPARQTRVIGPLVKQFSHRNVEVATESVIALGKFTSPDNFLCAEHSKTVVEFEGVHPLMRLLRGGERTQYHALVLLCYLSLHAGTSETFQQARLLTALEGADKSVACQYPEVRELVTKAVYHLNLSHSGFLSSSGSMGMVFIHEELVMDVPNERRAAFKTNSPAAKAITEQLIRLVNQSDNPVIKIPAIRAIGHLARTFPARQTQVIGPLVKQFSHRNVEVATESVIALGKFTSPDNFLCAEHSKTVVEFEGVHPLMRLLRGSERTQYHALVLLCYLSLHAGSSETFQQARLLTALEGADKSVACQYPEVRELVAKAVYHLNLSHSGVLLSQSKSFSR
ncbi:Armadillo [Artemisia annua]|uniref:Armadillo n=1 Tax=Artemisia annua TaxID=35608 RepID=A0A2U1M5K4_ARTAN|nr:Armadillo [Artemisia annua]